LNIQSAKQALDKVIAKSRVHLYKPIQIAEILYRDRTKGDIDLSDLKTYRNASKKWRDLICLQFLGRTSTSSARYQDDIFNENAIPPLVLAILGEENRKKNGAVEAYIYRKFQERFSQMISGLDYCRNRSVSNFNLTEFLNLFWEEPGLRRSIDKIYEIIVYALFSSLISALEVSIEVSINSDQMDVLEEFGDFTEKVLTLSKDMPSFRLDARINRLGVTNAADRGLDIWTNFGMAIQIKHLSLTEKLAKDIVSSVSADRIVIICKDVEKNVILSLLNQIGWRARIQSVITENDLLLWYEKALRGKFSCVLGEKTLENIQQEIALEFPTTNTEEFDEFFQSRYAGLDKDGIWNG
jgi:type II restriction enzyme